MTTNVDIKSNTFNGQMNFDGGGTVTLEQDAYVFATGDNGFEATGGPWTFTIEGVVASDLFGVVLYDTGVTTAIPNSKITVGSEGVVYATGHADAGIYSAQAADVTNDGWIQGDFFGIQLAITAPSSTTAVTITNDATGTIEGKEAGIQDTDTAHKLTVNNQGSISGVEWLGSATIVNNGTIDFLKHGTAAAFVDTITNTGTIGGNVQLGHGADVLNNTGDIQGFVDLLDGNNKATNDGHISQHLAAGSGNDTLGNSGHIDQFVDLGGGKNTLTNSGTIGTFVKFGTGADTLSNTATGVIGGDVTLGDGTNKVTNAGMIEGNLIGGTGTDVVNDTGGHVLGTIDLGAGNDTFTGGDFAETVKDGAGKDSYSLGGGDDTLQWMANGNDTIDGGLGSDTVSALTVAGNVTVNLDATTAFTFAGVTVAAGSINAGTSHGTIKGVEQVTGSDTGNDTLAGSAGHEVLNGMAGNDKIYGGGGADDLTGGLGSDTFIYTATTDSGPTVATRDTIHDFLAGGDKSDDKIDLSHIDADTTVSAAGDQAFTWIGANAPFDKAGELRYVVVKGDAIVQGDVDGDGKVDFSIDVVGVTTLTAGDFNL